MSYLFNKLRILLFAVCALNFSVQTAAAQSLSEKLEILIKTHKRVLASEADVSAANEQMAVASGAWYPTFDLTANMGHDHRNKPAGSTDTSAVARNVDMSLTQRLWDFGSTDASIERAKISLTQA